MDEGALPRVLRGGTNLKLEAQLNHLDNPHGLRKLTEAQLLCACQESHNSCGGKIYGLRAVDSTGAT